MGACASLRPSFPMSDSFKLDLTQRPRRLRRTATRRALVEETVLRPGSQLEIVQFVGGG